ncbi:MAG TPA: ABC transporter substrate-binding protein [Anaeromyxobacter sp.]|nr:ABC transporter substrate-binding protein [Anaeromyxobacter sp.]
MKKLIQAVLAAVLMVGSYSAQAADASKANKRLVVGFPQIDENQPWRTAESNSFKNEAAKYNIELKYVNAQDSQANQIAAIRSFIAQKVDAIVLPPKVETGWEPVLREAKRAKIPVFLVDRGLKTSDPSLYVTLLASDFVFEGEQAGKWLAKETNGKANIVELQGTTGAAPAIDRKKGFETAIKAFPGMKIIKSQDGNFTPEGGKQLMEAFLKAEGKNINAVYAHNDGMALGAIQAIEEAGLEPGKDIIIVSIDGIKDAFQAMVDGKLNATVECTPLLGGPTYQAIRDYFAGKQLPKWIKSNDQTFTMENAKEVIATRQY